MFLELYLGHCGFGGRPETKSMCTSSSGRCFLIFNGCWLLAFCVSWKKLDKAGVWAHYFSSQGFVNHVWFTERWCSLRGPYDGQFFFQPQRQTKTSLVKQNMLLWETLLLSNCFCFSGSNVSCNHLGMRVYLIMVWSCVFQTTTEKKFSLV